MTGDRLNLLIAAVTVVLSIVISYYFYRLAKKERRPVYVVTGNTVVKADEERKIEVRYKGEDVPVVTRTVVTFWNDGREPIRREDIVDRHPLIVQLPPDREILDARVVAQTRPEIDFSYVEDPFGPSIQLGFSHLNHRDGAAVEILHTGDPFAVEVEGAIVGVNGAPTRIESPLWSDTAGIIGPAILAFCFAAAGIIMAITGGVAYSLFVVPVVVYMGWMSATAWWKDRRRLPAPLREAVGPSESAW